MYIMSCQGKCFNTALYSSLMIILILQLLSTLERQVFDFLGYMWAPIIANFIQIICCIIGGFGTYQYRAKFIAVECKIKFHNTILIVLSGKLWEYSTWSLMWLGWNIFVICLYLEVGVLSRSRDLYILNIGTKNKSWWLEHGIGCRITNTSWQEELEAESSRPIPPEDIVQGCLLDYYYVEVIHAGVQCLLALMGFVFSCVNMYMYSEEEESLSFLCQSGKAGKKLKAAPANDELEFVKMYQNSSPSRRRYQSNDNQTFNDVATSEYPTLERPPSYETSMRESTVVNNIYASDRQSVRSLRSVRSKASSKSKNNNKQNTEVREELPWVQITPSSSNIDSPFRHYP